MSDIKIKLKEKRLQKGWSKTELSKRVSVSPQFLCDIESGRKNPSINVLVKLAKILEFSLDDLFHINSTSSNKN